MVVPMVNHHLEYHKPWTFRFRRCESSNNFFLSQTKSREPPPSKVYGQYLRSGGLLNMLIVCRKRWTEEVAERNPPEKGRIWSQLPMRGIVSNLGGGFKCLDNFYSYRSIPAWKDLQIWTKKSHVDFWRPKSQFDEQMFRIEATT